MASPEITTVSHHIAWSYANLARAHAALKAGRTSYARLDHIVRSRLFAGLCSGKMSISSLYDDERLKMLGERQCVYCGLTNRLTIDHLIPRIEGGDDDGVNLVLACQSCNSSKSGTDLLIWCEHKSTFPPLLLLRRYIKIVAEICEKEGFYEYDLSRQELKVLPFQIERLPHIFPALSELEL
jgi:HNH endonuclease